MINLESRVQTPYPGNRPISDDSSKISRVSTKRFRPQSGSAGTTSTNKKSSKSNSNTSTTGSVNIQSENEVNNSEVSQPASFYGRRSVPLNRQKSKVQVSCEEELQASSEYLETYVIPSILVAIHSLLRLVKDGKEPDDPLKFLAMVLVVLI